MKEYWIFSVCYKQRGAAVGLASMATVEAAIVHADLPLHIAEEVRNNPRVRAFAEGLMTHTRGIGCGVYEPQMTSPKALWSVGIGAVHEVLA